MTTHDKQDFEHMLEQALQSTPRWEGSSHAMFNNIRRKLQPKPWYRRHRPMVALGATALSLLLVLGIYHYMGVSFNPAPPVDTPPTAITGRPPVTAAADLPVVGTVEKLWELVSADYPAVINLDGLLIRGRDLLSSQFAGAEKAMIGTANAGHSTTNIQVQGVDEADIIKTDGTYLYQARGEDIIISKIYPDSEMQVAGSIRLADSYYAQEIYLDEKYLTIIATDRGGAGNEKRLWYFSSNTRILVYDITDREVPLKVRELEVDGSILSSRKVGSFVYLVAQKSLFEYLDGELPIVSYHDSARGKGRNEIGLDAIRFFPGIQHDAFLTVLALDVSDGKKEASVDVYLGSGRNIFMSKDNLYVAFEQWIGPEELQNAGVKTLVHKFHAEGTDVIYQGEGEVPGSILNQFSMHEYDGYFRIATTSHHDKMVSNVYVLDNNMQIVGTLEGLAPGERIYSVRFMGDKGYLVTFELIDPLFVIDLKDPTNPQVLGELKIPGFSNYLHPLDDNTLLGIGRDTDVVSQHGRLMVQEKGIKLAIFDVSDVNNPKELHVEIIGDAGSYSDALFDHKAVLFYNGVLSLPVYLDNTGFQGALAYHVSKQAGFVPIGRVSHYTDEKPVNRYYTPDVTRSLIINNVFYTVSNSFIKANRLAPGLPDLATLPLAYAGV